MIRKIALNRKEELLVPCDVESKASPVTREKSSSLVEVARRSAKTSSLQTLAAITLGYLIGFGHLSRNSFSSPAAFTCATTKERNKRPLQIFPLLKELKSGWANMQVPPLLNKNATGTRSLVIDVGLFSGEEFFYAIKHGFEVVGFEPSPESFPKLEKMCNAQPTCNVVDLDNVSLPLQREAGQSYLINAAAGNKPAVMQLMLSGPATSLTANHRLKDQNKVDVKVVRIDDIIRDDVYILKVDTQGFDQFVLEGASELLKNHVVRQVIVEVDPYNMGFHNHTVQSFLDLFQDNGMVCFQTHSDTHGNCQYFGESVKGFEKVFDGAPHKYKRWAECFEDFLCLNVEKEYPGKMPGMM